MTDFWVGLAHRAVEKVTSARFLMALVITLTGCTIAVKIIDLAWPEYKELVVFFIGQFIIIWKDIAQDYFRRPDRRDKHGTL